MQASVCVGDYAKIPYCVAGPEIPVYSMEELCYCIKENAFLLDTSLMNDALLDWIDRECGLRELAKELHPLIHRQGSLSAFVIMIMKYTGFYSAECIREVELVLKQGAGLSSIEKRKSQIDYLLKRKKYVSALHGYDSLLAKWQESTGDMQSEVLPGADVKAAILYNKGVVFTRLMLYRQAADAFWEAYGLDKKEDYMMAYMAAKRMELSEDEYIGFVAEMPQNFECSLALEKRLEQLKQGWLQHAEYQQLQERKLLREGSGRQKYYDENERLTQALKNSYRSSVQE